MAAPTITLRAKIVDLLKDENNQEEVSTYAAYCQVTLDAKDRQGKKKNAWMVHNHPQKLADSFKKVRAEGLVFDGKHITWISTGISYDYVADKNKMLVVYPESKMDVSVVNKADVFTVQKESGKVSYKHEVKNVFDSSEDDIVGAYCMIKNSRGEFLTLLNKKEIQKHRSVAKTDYIWKAWFKEMVMKTIIKKAVKYHFDDIFAGIEEEDNKQYDPEQVVVPPTEEEEEKESEAAVKLKAAKTEEELRTVWAATPIAEKKTLKPLLDELKEKVK